MYILAGPRTMGISELEKLGVTVHHDIREAVANADVVNVLQYSNWNVFTLHYIHPK